MVKCKVVFDLTVTGRVKVSLKAANTICSIKYTLTNRVNFDFVDCSKYFDGHRFCVLQIMA